MAKSGCSRALGACLGIIILLIVLVVFAISAPAQTPAASPTPPNDDPVLVACEACANRLTKAETDNTALQKQIVDLRDIIEAKDKIIGQQDGIISRYEKMNSNSGRIQNIDDQRVSILQTQLGDAQRKLDSCRSNEKWIAGGSFVAGIFVDRKLLNNNGAQSVLLQNAGTSTAQRGFTFTPSYPLSFYGETDAEKTIRRALKNLPH